MDLLAATVVTCFFGFLSFVAHGVDLYRLWHHRQATPYKLSKHYLAFRITILLLFITISIAFIVLVTQKRQYIQLLQSILLLESTINEAIRTARLYKALCEYLRIDACFETLRYIPAIIVVACQVIGFVLICAERRNDIAKIIIAIGECIMHGLLAIVCSILLWQCRIMIMRRGQLFRFFGLIILSSLSCVAAGILLLIYNPMVFLLGQSTVSFSLDVFWMGMQIRSELFPGAYESGLGQEDMEVTPINESIGSGSHLC